MPRADRAGCISRVDVPLIEEKINRKAARKRRSLPDFIIFRGICRTFRAFARFLREEFPLYETNDTDKRYGRSCSCFVVVREMRQAADMRRTRLITVLRAFGEVPKGGNHGEQDTGSFVSAEVPCVRRAASHRRAEGSRKVPGEAHARGRGHVHAVRQAGSGGGGGVLLRLLGEGGELVRTRGLRVPVRGRDPRIDGSLQVPQA